MCIRDSAPAAQVDPRLQHRMLAVTQGEGQTAPEATATAKLAVHPHLAAHGLGQPFADAQAEPGAAVPASGGAIRLLEGFEQPRLLRRAQADAGIAHREQQPDLLLSLIHISC